MISKLHRLPDFLQDSQFNVLRAKMNAPLAKDTWDLEQILTTSGFLLNNIREIEKTKHGIFFKGKRVILYIRDVMTNGSYEPKLPKYHLVDCQTLENMWKNNRNERYVVTKKLDGQFMVNIGGKKGIWEKLDVCKYCLTAMNWNNYAEHSYNEKKNIFDHFLLSDFFAKYSNSNILYNGKEKSRNSSLIAPLNEYSSDWKTISYTLRQDKNWICEGCHADFKDKKSLLHVHHINGEKSDNHRSNLKVLCHKCHADEPLHSHMKGLT